MNKSSTRLILCLASFFSSQLLAQESCPAANHVSEICGTLTVTDYMGVPGTSPKFWIQSNDQLIRLGTYEGNWGLIAMAAYRQEDVCLYSDQKVIEDRIEIAEFCR